MAKNFLGLPVTLIAAQETLAFPPTSVNIGWLTELWGLGVVGARVPREWELHMESQTDGGTLTAGIAYMLTERALVVADTPVQGEADDEKFTATAHALQTGDGPFYLSGGTLPTGTLTTTPYWIIRIDADTFYLALSRVNAFIGAASKVSITTDGTGNSLVDDAATTRVKFEGVGKLGYAGDGTVDFTILKGYSVPIRHSARAIGYAITGTMTSGKTISAYAYPVFEED